MLAALRNRLQLVLERFLVRGPIYRLAFVIGIIAGISLAGGLLVVGSGLAFTNSANSCSDGVRLWKKLSIG